MKIKKLLEDFVNNNPDIAIAYKALGDDTIIGVNHNEIFPVASFLKIPIALSFYHNYQNLIPQPIEEIKGIERSKYNNLWGSFSGSKLTYRALMGLSLSVSDNYSSNLLIEKQGIAKINQFIKKELKLKQTRLETTFSDQHLNKSGLANVSSASECIQILEYAYRQASLSSSFLFNSLLNTRIPRKIPEGIKVMHKTGTLSGAVMNAAIIMGENPFALAILSKNQISSSKISNDMGEIAFEIFKIANEN